VVESRRGIIERQGFVAAAAPMTTIRADMYSTNTVQYSIQYTVRASGRVWAA
jgi:hypothetical protein